ncbi:uncharacterized protein KQ657_002439 [Scheffersomyces spartinae]|uniref:Uncharacterized protein n=1 Tax=Scheffersomyces spartinae TaxID=45513 RepID=A0A9P7V656_9ASCO|nr:uncharacterized protein KQ657_002439 [Scheffersomyces spartinae]KAG7192079.1 hypothetical protein KQ657_002439 [Scheffersomyces spartinae]
MLTGIIRKGNPLRSFSTSSFLQAGHSKWANIRHDKAKNDKLRAKQASMIATRIQSSVRQYGVEGNAQLQTLVDKAKKMSITKKVIDNAIKRGSGESSGDGSVLSQVTYEFIGPGGVAFIIEAETDNKSRTIGLVKHAMTKFNSGLSPCLYLFSRKGEVLFAPKSSTEGVDELLDVAIEVGAEDVDRYNDVDEEYRGETIYRMITDPQDLFKVSQELSKMGYQLKDSKTSFLAELENEVEFPEDHEKGLSKAIAMLDEIPEVTNYYTNIKDNEE